MAIITVGGKVGPRLGADSGELELRHSRDGCLIVQDGHARYQEAIFRGNCYSVTLGSTTISANHASTTAATATAFVGIYNPPTSKVNAVILEAVLGASAAGASAVNEGVPVWQYVVPVATTVTSATSPLNMLSYLAQGSKVIGLVNSQALTANTATWAQLKPFGVPGPRTAAPTASINIHAVYKELVDGEIIVPPGVAVGLFYLAAGTAISAVGGLVWEEIAI